MNFIIGLGAFFIPKNNIKGCASMIKIKNLSKIFNSNENTLTVLNNINLHIDEGDILGIIGVSGAGKSTLMRCIGGLETPTTGNIWIDSTDILTLSSKEKINLYKKLGTVFQGYNLLLQKTVAENIALPLIINHCPKKQVDIKVKELLTLVGLEDKANAYPAQLSGGQKQRVAIARALVNNPKILLCDEPTSALDCITTKSILNLLRDINKKFGVTIVIITHDIEVVKNICTKVVVLDESNLVEEGATPQVISNPQSIITQRFLA